MKETTTAAKNRLHILTESALAVALSTVLSFVTVYHAPFGGSVTLLSMAPIILLSWFRGPKAGMAAGFVHGCIQLILGLSNIAWVTSPAGQILCGLLDYLLPFTLLGLGGVFRGVRFCKNDKANAALALLCGTVMVCVLRFACHMLSSVVIWYALDLEWYADDPTHIVNRYSKWIFAAVYNVSYMLPETVSTSIGVPLMAGALTKAFRRT